MSLKSVVVLCVPLFIAPVLLGGQTPVAKKPLGGKAGTAKPPQPAHSNTEIMEWLVAKVNGHAIHNKCKLGYQTSNDITRSDDLQAANLLSTSGQKVPGWADSCTAVSTFQELTIYTSHSSGRFHGTTQRTNDTIGWFALPLDRLNPDSVEVTQANLCENAEEHELTIYRVSIRATDNKSVIIGHYTLRSQSDQDGDFGDKHTTNPPSERDSSESDVKFYFEDQSVADRVAEAFRDLVTQCGGKTDTKAKDIY
jgi:hypothetical protein